MIKYQIWFIMVFYSFFCIQPYQTIHLLKWQQRRGAEGLSHFQFYFSVFIQLFIGCKFISISLNIGCKSTFFAFSTSADVCLYNPHKIPLRDSLSLLFTIFFFGVASFRSLRLWRNPKNKACKDKLSNITIIAYSPNVHLYIFINQVNLHACSYIS